MDIFARDILHRLYYNPDDIYHFNNTYDISVQGDLIEDTFNDGYMSRDPDEAMFTIGTHLPVHASAITFEKWYGHHIHNLETGEHVFAEWVVLTTPQGYTPVYVTYIRQNGDREKYIIDKGQSIYEMLYPGGVCVEKSAFYALLWSVLDYEPPDSTLSSSITYFLTCLANRIMYRNAYVTAFPEDLRIACYHNSHRLILERYRPLIEDIKHILADSRYHQMTSDDKEKTLDALIDRHMTSTIRYVDPIAMKKWHHIKDLYWSSHTGPIDTQALPLSPKYTPMHALCDDAAYNASYLYDILSIDLHVTDIEITCTLLPLEFLHLQDIHVWTDRYTDISMYQTASNTPQIHTEQAYNLFIDALSALTGDIRNQCGIDLYYITHVTFTKTIREEALLEFHPQSGAYEDGLSVIFDFVYAALTAASLSTDNTP